MDGCFLDTKKALESLQLTLYCCKCSIKCKELFTLGQCEHRFCRVCAEACQGQACYVCSVPSRSTQILVDKQLSHIASLCFDLELLLTAKFNKKKEDLKEETSGSDISGSLAVELIPIKKCALSTSHQQSSSSSVKKGDRSSKSKNALKSESCTPKSCKEKAQRSVVPVSVKKTDKTTSKGGRLKPVTVICESKEDSCPRSNKKFTSIKSDQRVSTPVCEKLVSTRLPVKGSAVNKPANKTKSYLSKRNAKGETPLQVATIKADTELVQKLLEEGANPNVRDNAGWTPLHEAVNYRLVGIAELLIKYGASVNAPGLDNDTPLHEAVSNNCLDCITLLVNSGAKVTSRNINGYTPLDVAKSDDVRKILLDSESENTSFMSFSTTELMDDKDEQPVCLLGTSLSHGSQTQLKKCAKILGVKIAQSFSSEISHLVTGVNSEGQCPRTLSYLNAILCGKWIVNVQWLESCIEYSQLVSEEAFEVNGCVTNPDSGAPQRARQNRHEQLPSLFDGCQFFFHGLFNPPSPSRDELVALVKYGGGTILTREPRLHNLDDYPYTVPYHATPESSLADCAIFVIYDDTCPSPPQVAAERMSCLPVTWLLDSIASFSLRKKTDYVKI